MKRRITAALLTAILIISCFPSGVMTTVSRADDAKKENILTKISEDAVLKYTYSPASVSASLPSD